MICKYCGKEMILDDTDFRFDGCEDRYWLCENCEASCFEKIRYHKSVGHEFSPPEYATHEVELVKDLLYKGCEDHWRCKHCGECIPVHCYGSDELEQMFCKEAYDAEQQRRTARKDSED